LGCLDHREIIIGFGSNFVDHWGLEYDCNRM
jgi:hypothetical protein